MANKLEVSNRVLVFYMSYLHEVLKKCKMVDMVAFVDPDHIGTLGCGNPTESAWSLSDRYRQGRLGQIFVVPYNLGAHWMLTVVNLNEEVVHFMDSLKRRLDTGEWKSIVNNFIKIYNAHKNRKGRKGILEQKNDKTCGYFIMRYMKEIVEDKNLDFSIKWGTGSNLVYTDKDIDEIRAEWAKHVLKFPEN
ncbi:uncharacterized protein LOC133730446 [Rosa rugosa]|uniref:uncharacterized protein LOC133730446 n=1 Tax=Rosa rugosa TaxID=74645 RepID=UPI002B41661F|nr:uncharacterized protein LOC133730446 [Rosa rugosa]